MTTSEIASNLQALGLDEEQARVYITLLRAGPSKASDITPQFGWSRSKVYRILEDLNKKGAISKTLESPTVFHPASPEELFSLRREELNLQKKRFNVLEDSFFDHLKAIETKTPETQPEHYSRVEGLQTILQVLQHLFTEAEESIDVAGNHEALTMAHPIVEDTWRVMLGKAAEGVRLRVLAEFEEPPAVRVEDASWKDNARFRRLEPGKRFLFALVDGEDLLHWIRAAPGPRADDVAAVTNGPAVRDAYEVLFGRSWSEAEDIGETIQQALLPDDPASR